MKPGNENILLYKRFLYIQIRRRTITYVKVLGNVKGMFTSLSSPVDTTLDRRQTVGRNKLSPGPLE